MTFDAPDLFAKAVRQQGHFVRLGNVVRSPMGKGHKYGTCRCGADLEVFSHKNGQVSARGSALETRCPR